MNQRTLSEVPGDGVPAPGGAGAGNLLAELRGAGGGGDLPAADSAAPKRRRRLHTQTLVLALVLSASVASLYTMRKQGMGAGLKFMPVGTLDYKAEQLKPEDVRAQQRVMAELARSVSPDSFHDEPLRKNPFKLDAPANIPKALPGEVQIDAEQAAKLKRAQEIQDSFRQLNLNGVMQGPVPLARINGRTVKESDTIDNIFMVVSIHERSVDLMADEQLYTLQMSDTSIPGSKKPGMNQPNMPRR